MNRPSIPVRALAGLLLAVSALTVTALAVVVIVLIADAADTHALMTSGG